jgi:Flp pilus assembly protein TadD
MDAGSALSHTENTREIERMAHLAQATREVAFEEAVAKLKRGDLGSALETFQRIAAERPGERKYRLYLTYTRGRVYLLERRDEDAQSEFRRALAIDGTFEPARKALESMKGPPEDDRGGFFKKFFGKS